ncbi:MAG: hypothetical protein F7C35_01015 [Desulfurococcales archaeon]|nr:hypothetical protein [Desulfurococcales archaeon]
MAGPHDFESALNSLIDREIERLVNEIAWIDGRLLELGDDEESEVERKLLRILRRHLMKDLYELAGFVWDEPSVGGEVEHGAPLSSAVRARAET